MPVEPSDIVAGYRLLLGREPENAAVVAEKQALPDIAALRAVLLNSDEFRAGLPALLEDDRIAATRRQLDALYDAMLGRVPDRFALADLQENRRSAAEIARRIADSEEYRTRQREQAALAGLRAAPRMRREGPPRILLFGAYGNGNLGDAAQAGALARLVGHALGPACCEASSWLDRSAYDAGPARRRAPNVLLDGEKLAEFAGVLFGGGGLFSPAHFPLDQPAWVRWFTGLGIPYGFVGIGATPGVTRAPEVRPAMEELFGRAAFLSIRDATNAWSVSAVAPFRSDWFELPDPVLLAGLLDAPRCPAATRTGTLLVVKAPAPGDTAEEEVLATLATHAADHPATTRVAILEPRRDRGLADAFPSPLLEPAGMEDLLALCGSAERVVSMRLHGAVAAILAGVPVLAGPAAKARALLRDIGCAENGIAETGALRQALAASAPAVPAEEACHRLRRLGEDGLCQIARALKAAGVP